MPEDPSDSMVIDWDVPIPTSDGVVLAADVYRPRAPGRFPVIASYGPYGKNLSFQEAYPTQWAALVEACPEVLEGSSCRYVAWEVVDPEKWVPHGYVVLRVDSRGAGRSPGKIDCFGARETQDFYECIEWAGAQPWSNGRIGLSGVSYYAINQWQVAAMRPPHLAAICPWEGAADWYRDVNFHGGIPSSFLPRWFEHQVASVQHGLDSRGRRHPHTGILVSGEIELTEVEMARNRPDLKAELREHPYLDRYWLERTADLSKIVTPILSAGNWGGQGLHLRGNIEGYYHASSLQKWLEIHGGKHWVEYYSRRGLQLQQEFFDFFLKDQGQWNLKPTVILRVRHPGDRFEDRFENEWPLVRTKWTTFYLDAERARLGPRPGTAGSITYEGFSDGIRFSTEPFHVATEITGPITCKLYITSATADADIFVVLHLLDSNGSEVFFDGATEPKQSLSQGWLRASHRELDLTRSSPWQPVHPHERGNPLVPGEIYELDIEVWPTCIVAPPGYRLGLSVLGRDYDHHQEGVMSHLGYELRGCGLNVHDDPEVRPASLFGGRVTLHTGGQHLSHLLLPVIPPSG